MTAISVLVQKNKFCRRTYVVYQGESLPEPHLIISNVLFLWLETLVPNSWFVNCWKERRFKFDDSFFSKCLFLMSGMIGVMEREAGFTIYNPCSILTTYHVHCSRIGTRYVKGHNSIRNKPWSLTKRPIKLRRPVTNLTYGPDHFHRNGGRRDKSSELPNRKSIT